jgi:ABC-type branched-subunit amino acid transport system substrate-binding protein
MGDHAKDLGIHAPGIVILNVNFIAPVQQSLEDSLQKNGIQWKSVDQVSPSQPDYTNLALKLQSEGVDSVIAALDPFSYSRMFEAFQRQNFHPKVFGLGLDKASANQAYNGAQAGAESLTPLLEPWDHMSQAGVAAYEGAVQKYFPNQVPALDVYSEGDWVAAEMFVDALRAIGSAPITRQSLVNALNSLKNVDTQGLTEPISYSAGNAHDPNRCFQWIHYVNNGWATYSNWNCF